jgi:hypothetical protein
MRALSVTVSANSEQGVEVDIFGYKNDEEKALELDLDAGLVEVAPLDAVAVVPKYNTTFHGIHNMPPLLFLESGNKSGASTTM